MTPKADARTFVGPMILFFFLGLVATALAVRWEQADTELGEVLNLRNRMLAALATPQKSDWTEVEGTIFHSGATADTIQAQMLSNLKVAAVQHSIELISSEGGQSKAGQYVGWIDVTLELLAKHENFLSFLADLESAKPSYKVVELQIAPAALSPPSEEADVKLQIRLTVSGPVLWNSVIGQKPGNVDAPVSLP